MQGFSSGRQTAKQNSEAKDRVQTKKSTNINSA